MSDPARILVVRTDRLGDVILTLPVFGALRRRFPGAHLAMLAGRYAGAIVEGYAPVDEILWYDDDGGLVPFRAMRGMLKKGRFDAAVIVHPTLRLALLAFLARIPVRIGSGYRYYSFLFNRRVYAHRKTAGRHELEYNMELLAPLGCDTSARRPLDVSLDIPRSAREKASALLEEAGVAGKFVVIHPGSGGSARDWPQGNFSLLARMISGVKNLQVVVTGTERESALAGAVARGASPPGVNLAGRLGLKELAAVIEQAALFVSNSTGPLHVAVAVGTPVVGLFPRIPVMGPGRWGPYTDNARVLVPDAPPDCDACTGKPGTDCACMGLITVDAVFAAAGELLSLPSPTERHHLHES